MRHLSAPFMGLLVIAGLFFYAAPSLFLSTEPQHVNPEIEVSLWASQPMLKNPVGLTHDPDGRIYVTEANRRKSADLDVRNMRDLEPLPWPVIDYSIQSVAQRREVIHRYLAPDSPFPNPWLKDYDGDGEKNWRDLLAKTERVNLLEDTDGDGRADRATVFAEGFNTEVTGTAGDVLWHDNKVYLAVIPDLWRLDDTDHDGVADDKVSLITGHGVHIGQGGHDLHGLTVGPDGRIYWSVGDKGANIVSHEGRQFFYPNQGLVMRSEPDGSNFEVFAHGLRNCMELAFDDFGNLFCVDNDGDFKGERERFVYVTRFSDTGWRINWQYDHTNKWARDQGLPDYNPWMEEQLYKPHFEGQAAYITPALANYSDGPAGFARNPGTALSETYADYFFLTQFPGQKITAFQIEPDGAAFKMQNEHLFQGSFMATGLSFGPDGALYVADWAGNWEPTRDGGIFKLDVKPDSQHPLRAQTERLIQEGLEHLPADSLARLMRYPDQRIRKAAQFELVHQNQVETLTQTALDRQADILARVHALWGMGQLARMGNIEENYPLDVLLTEANAQINIQTCRLLTEAPPLFSQFEPLVVDLLASDNLSVRFHAAQALGSIGSSAAVAPLLDLLASDAGADPFIRHGVATGLAGIADVAALESAKDHPSNSVRLGVVVALRRLQSPAIAAFLDDPDPLVVTEAARAIHDDFGIPEAMPALAELLNTTPHVDNEALMRRVLNANLRLGETRYAKNVLAFFQSEKGTREMKEEAVDVLVTWTRPPVLDRVERRYRKLPPRDPEGVRSVLQTNLSGLLASNTRSSTEAIRLLNHYNISLDPEILQHRLTDAARPVAERIEVLRLLATQARQRNAAFETAFSSPETELRIEALHLMAQKDEPVAVKRIDTILSRTAPLRERQHAIALLGILKGNDATRLLGERVDALQNGDLPKEERLDVFQAASAHGGFDDKLQALQGAAADRAPLSYTLFGGNPARGEEIFLKHPVSQCIRCHAVEPGEGSNVGPNLSGISGKVDRAYLLESLVRPGAKIADGFENGTGVSAMPPMGALLSPTELRDLIAYLAQL